MHSRVAQVFFSFCVGVSVAMDAAMSHRSRPDPLVGITDLVEATVEAV